MDFTRHAGGWPGASDYAAGSAEGGSRVNARNVCKQMASNACFRARLGKRRRFSSVGVAALLFLCSALAQESRPAPVGIFEQHGDIGETPKAGTMEYDAGTGEYRVTGGGANIWATVDAFHFAWKRISGDVTVTADVKFIGTGAVDHRKAVLMIRQSLNPDAAYADVSLHGDGLTSLQFRTEAGVETAEQRSTLSMPARIRIERRGNRFT